MYSKEGEKRVGLPGGLVGDGEVDPVRAEMLFLSLITRLHKVAIRL